MTKLIFCLLILFVAFLLWRNRMRKKRGGAVASRSSGGAASRVFRKTSSWFERHSTPPASDRLVEWGELGMGGPNIEYYLLKERVYFGGVCDGIMDFDGGNLRLAREACRGPDLYHLYDKQANRLFQFPPEAMKGVIPLLKAHADERAIVAELRKLLESGAHEVALYEYHGVYLTQRHVDEPEVILPSLSNNEMSAKRVMPDDLFMMKEPLFFIRNKFYQLCMNGRPLDIFMRAPERGYFISADAEECCVEGVSPDENANKIFHLYFRGRWFVIDQPFATFDVGDRFYCASLESPQSLGQGKFRFSVKHGLYPEVEALLQTHRAVLRHGIKTSWRREEIPLTAEESSLLIDLNEAML
ncbi:hypothetical protein SOASR030_23760 [Leminorella grimontii]|uniref:Uncharacterized protein n=1 Tax=Leminorella grimontii TaxID=82981 RepID=A0AAV5N5L6_9GAMM|nr:hypothetical protein [Leminorella grimontii]KFC95137.1 hypothetical protein GLGR_2205 [Leminorella grimontii ATCC 33999 = DSM 5078]GKX56264.1 hypothetical protein SOASR030_23760 [Leminorella grimontii]VFS60856.1 Uncharacterised protein [Leminorella grimontii]